MFLNQFKNKQMEQKEVIRQYCQQFNMTGVNKVIDELITEAESKAMGYLDYTVSFLRTEADYRQQRDMKADKARGPPQEL